VPPLWIEQTTGRAEALSTGVGLAGIAFAGRRRKKQEVKLTDTRCGQPRAAPCSTSAALVALSFGSRIRSSAQFGWWTQVTRVFQSA
jgi:hypothetical protein